MTMLAYGWSRRDTPYAMVLPAWWRGSIIPRTAESCVSIVEDCLDQVGAGLFDWYAHALFFTPYDIWEDTVPVHTITERRGYTVDVPVRGLVARGAGPTFIAYDHYDPTWPYDLVAGPLPSGATFGPRADGAHHFVWTPSRSDVGRTVEVTFTMTADVPLPTGTTWERTFEETLTVRVSGATDTFTVGPSIPGGVRELGLYVSTPLDAMIHGAWLIDEETGEEITPTSVPFPGQELRSLTQGYRYGIMGMEPYYGFRFELAYDGGGESLPDQTWRVIVDWSVPRWTNL